MNFIKKLENYFNSGSTDKQNKRRLGGLLIGITAILLVIAILATSGLGIYTLATEIIPSIGELFDKDNGSDDEGDATNTHLEEKTLEDVKAAATGTVVLDDKIPEGFTFTPFGEATKRPKKEDGKTAIYKATIAEGLQADALAAFNQMISDFHKDATNDNVIWAKKAYDNTTPANNTGYYVNALTVSIAYEYTPAEGGETKVESIYGVEDNDDFEWIFKNADKYGFVRVSNAEGEENIFRYVGLAHAKAIYSQQKRSNDTFYTVDNYFEEIKASTPDKKLSSKGYKSIEDDGTMTYYTYYMTEAEGQVYKLPTDAYEYTVTATEDGGYVVTYWKAAKK